MTEFDRLTPEIKERYEAAQTCLQVVRYTNPDADNALWRCGTPEQRAALILAYRAHVLAAQNCLGTEAAKILEAIQQVIGETK